MHRAYATNLIILCIAIVCSGCTSYASKPIIIERTGSEKKEIISSFTYKVNSPWRNSRFKKSAYEATKKNIPNAAHNKSEITTSSRPDLVIEISEFRSGGACGQDYLTGLSLGLIPSWCTRPILFKFDFVLNKNHEFCRQKTYSISSTTFAHIILIPFATLNAEDQPLTLYQAALRDFIHEDQCANP